MPQLSGNFGPIPSQVVLDANGSGTVAFQPNGNNARITTLFVKVSTSVKQAAVTIYKGQVSDTNIVGNTNSGSTGAPAFGNIDLFDGETLYVVWTGGDVGATATATFVGQTIPLGEVGGSELRWSDPIAAADGSLIFPAIKSPNFVTGVMGWYLDRNGNIELNNAVVRGELDVVGTNGAYVKIYNFGGVDPLIQLKPAASNVGDYSQIGFINTSTSNGASNHYGDLVIGPPGFGSAGFLDIAGDSAEGAKSYANFFHLDIQKNSVDMGGGRVTGIDTATSSAAIGNTETVVLTIPSYTYQAGRAYSIEFTGLVVASVAGNMPTMRTRKTNPAGQRFTNGSPYCGTTSPTTGDFRSMFTVGASNVTASLVLTIQGSATFNATLFGSATTTTSLDVYDIGVAADHPNIPVLI
jgi:hypothetical protein